MKRSVNFLTTWSDTVLYSIAFSIFFNFKFWFFCSQKRMFSLARINSGLSTDSPPQKKDKETCKQTNSAQLSLAKTWIPNNRLCSTWRQDLLCLEGAPRKTGEPGRTLEEKARASLQSMKRGHRTRECLCEGVCLLAWWGTVCDSNIPNTFQRRIRGNQTFPSPNMQTG